MATGESLSESLEDYLKAIFHIVAEKQAARAKDIALRLKVGSPSVTGALHSLTEKGLINYKPYDLITLTSRGRRVARDVVRRHQTLCRFLIDVLGVNEVEASETACKMEHAISGTILKRLIQFVQFVDAYPLGGAKWIKGVGYSYEQGESRESSISPCVEDVGEGQSRERSMETMSVGLAELQPGKKGRILRITGSGQTKKRLVEMGVTPGTVVELERTAPLGDPIEITVRGYSLSLRKEEANGITVEPLEADSAR